MKLEDVDFENIHKIFSNCTIYENVNEVTRDVIAVAVLGVFGSDAILKVIKELGIDIKINIVGNVDDHINKRVNLSHEENMKEHAYYKENVRKFCDDVIFCMYGKKLDEIAIKGKVRFIMSGAWAGEVIENPTWLDVCIEAQKMVDHTGDRHHIYIESIKLVGECEGIQIRHFGMGS